MVLIELGVSKSVGKLRSLIYRRQTVPVLGNKFVRPFAVFLVRGRCVRSHVYTTPAVAPDEMCVTTLHHPRPALRNLHAHADERSV